MTPDESTHPACLSEDIEWLTPAPDGAPVVLPWPDEAGPFLLTCHLARVCGRAKLVGLDVRSFTADGSFTATGSTSMPALGPHGLSEVNHAVLRSLRAGEIAEAARVRLAAIAATQSSSTTCEASVRAAATRTVTVLTAPNPSRPNAPRPASEQLQRVADLYLRAVAAGGDRARKPSVHVHRALIDDGVDVSLNTVRGQIHRARVKGLIPARA